MTIGETRYVDGGYLDNPYVNIVMDQDNANVDRLLVAKEVAAWLRTGVSTIYQWADANKIPHIRINGVLRFSKAEVLAWLLSKGQTVQPPQQGSMRAAVRMAVPTSVLKQAGQRVRTHALGGPRESVR